MKYKIKKAKNNSPKEIKEKLKDTDFFDQILRHILKSAMDEIRSYHNANKKFFKNRDDFADYIGANDSMIKKLLAKNVKQKSIASIGTLLKLCDKMGIPVKAEYEIGLHSCFYQNQGYMSNKRNIHSERYEMIKLPVKEIKKRVSDGAPYFYDYKPKIIPMTIGDKDILINLETVNDEKRLRNLLKYEKALNTLLKSIK